MAKRLQLGALAVGGHYLAITSPASEAEIHARQPHLRDNADIQTSP
jgi:hypothetical protein